MGRQSRGVLDISVCGKGRFGMQGSDVLGEQEQMNEEQVIKPVYEFYA